MLVIYTKIFATFVLIVLPVHLGSRLGRYLNRKSPEVNDSPLGSVVGAALGLLAFMLAFTFQLAANRYDSRKELLLDEVVAIRTTYLRAGLLKDVNKVPIQRLIREYVDLRILLNSDMTEVTNVISQSKDIQDSLWAQAMALTRENRNSETYALFISSLNELIDTHNRRAVINLQYRIPSIVLFVLYFISFFSMLILGFQFGVSGNQHRMPIVFSLAAIFSVVMWLIFALDDPKLGIIRLNQEQVYELRQELDVR
jgi:hypothetical protein